MKAILAAVGSVALIGTTASAFWISTTGNGIPGRLDEPVSVRDDSVRQTHGGHGMAYYYFFGAGRGHRGGSYDFGK